MIQESIMFVSLIVEIEERLGIEIPAAYLDIDNLENNINVYLYDDNILITGERNYV